jgi:hypothetical protein
MQATYPRTSVAVAAYYRSNTRVDTPLLRSQGPSSDRRFYPHIIIQPAPPSHQKGRHQEGSDWLWLVWAALHTAHFAFINGLIPLIIRKEEPKWGIGKCLLYMIFRSGSQAGNDTETRGAGRGFGRNAPWSWSWSWYSDNFSTIKL